MWDVWCECKCEMCGVCDVCECDVCVSECKCVECE